MSAKVATKGLGGVFERGGLWYIRFVWKGRTYRESSESRRKSVATALLKKRLAAVQDSTFIPAGARTKLSDILALTVTNYKGNRRRSLERLEGLHVHLERILGADTPVEAVLDRIEPYQRKRLAEGAAPGTVNREMAALRRAFRLGIKARILSVMPMFEMFDESENVRTGFPEPEEVERIIGEVPERLKDAVRFLSLTGWRLGEGIGLQWGNVDPKTGDLRLERQETKGKEVRTFPYTESPELAALIEERRAVTTAWEREHGAIVPWVFWSPGTDSNGNPVAVPCQLQRSSLEFRLAAERAHCSHIRAHDLRRMVARRLIRNGVEESVAMKLLGHRTPSIFRRYNITTGDDLRKAVRLDSEGIREAETSRKSRQA